MIRNAHGNLLEAQADALVNTVNCVGHMGKGIALQFKQAYPANYDAYRRACDAGEVRPGRMFVYETGMMFGGPKYIINFPTKRHWRGASRPEDIRAGLTALISEVRDRKIKSIAVPPLGCGNGGLEWSIVRPMILKAFERVPDVEVLMFAPHGAPDPKAMPVHTAKPRMTVARALFVKLMEQYLTLAYRLTLLEIQKLAYFLQEAGEPLKLKYDEGHFGPYATNLNKVLERVEGHLTRGYGDSQKPDVEIELLPGATSEADAFLTDQPGSNDRLARVAALIEGFETPYGMELLSSVHWVARREESRATDADSAIQQVHAWTARKRGMFKAAHIRVAWQRLAEQGWLSAPDAVAP